MKKILSFAGLALFIAFLSVAVSAAFGADLHTCAAITSAVLVPFHALTASGWLPMPAGILGEYVGVPGVKTDSGSVGVQVINSERARGAFMAYRTKPEYDGKDITQSFLRLETVITNDSRLVFKTFSGDGATVAPTEQRLDRNDKFIITELGLQIMRQTIGKPGSGRLVSYPNLTEFGATAAGFLESIFNGVLGITIGRKKWLPVVDTQRFLHVPQTQQSGTGNRDLRDMSKIMVALTPHIEIDGSGTNEIEIQYPTYAGWAGATPVTGGDEHRAVFYAHGLLITGGSANI